jgi:hypothetical protein
MVEGEEIIPAQHERAGNVKHIQTASTKDLRVQSAEACHNCWLQFSGNLETASLTSEKRSGCPPSAFQRLPPRSVTPIDDTGHRESA